MSGLFRSVDPLSKYYNLEHFKQIALKTPTKRHYFFLHKAKLIPSAETTFFYCNHFNGVGEKGLCASTCKGYHPRNGKSGICTHYRNNYEDSGECYVLNYYGNGKFRLEHVKLKEQ